MFVGRLASTPPPIVSGAFVLVAFITYLSPSEGEPSSFVIGLWGVLTAFSVLWCLDLYVLSTRLLAKRPSIWSLGLYFVAIMGAAAVLPLSLSRPADDVLSLGSVATIVLALLAMWNTSIALVAAEGARNQTGVLISFFQIIYLVVGVWFLCPRIDRLLAMRDGYEV